MPVNLKPCGSIDSGNPFDALENRFMPEYPDVWRADWMNALTLQEWRDFLVSLCLTRFEWINVPEELDPRYIELVLLFNGIGCFFETAPGHLAFCPATPVGTLDMYYNPDEVELVPGNGQGGPWVRHCQPHFKTDPETGEVDWVDADAAVCFDNMTRSPLMAKVELVARRLADLDRKVDVNCSAQATPWIGACSEEARGDLAEMMKQITGNEPVLMTSDVLVNDVSFEVANTQAPFVADQLMLVAERRVNQFCTMVGIDNAFSQKKEREVAGEMDANDEQIYIMRESALRCRQKACQRANQLFHTKMQVRFATRLNEGGGVDFSDEAVKTWSTGIPSGITPSQTGEPQPGRPSTSPSTTP